MSDISKSSTNTIPMDNKSTTESANTTSPTKKVIKFHSRAKPHSDEIYLSNFQMVPGGLVIDCVPYLTVEHYYQSMKFKDKDRANVQGLRCGAADGKASKVRRWQRRHEEALRLRILYGAVEGTVERPMTRIFSASVS